MTGGTSGIGLEIATQLGKHGAAVAVTGRRQAVLDEACEAMRAAGITVLGLQGDVRQQESCDKWVSQVSACHNNNEHTYSAWSSVSVPNSTVQHDMMLVSVLINKSRPCS